jgi:hypothetical protein
MAVIFLGCGLQSECIVSWQLILLKRQLQIEAAALLTHAG